MQTEILTLNDKSVEMATEQLNNGNLIGMPTETVYGLAAIGTNPTAVKKIFEVKGRPSDNPLIAHVHKDFDLSKIVKITTPYALELKKAFTPGPLTMVFESTGVVCKEAVCGGETLAVRIPSHEGCQKLLKRVNAPVVAPSANISKHTSPVTAKHVFDDLNGKIPLILDGGKCVGGIESTVLDVTGPVPRILRAGLITKEMIESVCGACEIAKHKEGDRVKSPGVKYRHYRPKCETILKEKTEVEEIKRLYKENENSNKRVYIMCENDMADAFDGLNLLLLGKDGEETASNLYDKLLEGEKKADLIIAVSPGRYDGVYLGIMNRLTKSCG